MSIKAISLPVDDLSIKQIRPSANQLRRDQGNIDGLCASINSIGLLQPIVVRPMADYFEVVAGNRRFEACKRLRWKSIPCHVVELDDRQAFEVSLVENLDRKTLDPFDEARAFKKYVSEAGWGGMTALSKGIGRSPAYISKRIRLLSLPEKVLEQLLEHGGRKNVTLMEELLPLDEEDQLQLCKAMETTELSSRDVRRMVKAVNESKSLDTSHLEVWKDVAERQKFIARCIDQTISALRVALVRFDGVLDKLTDEWTEREILMQYRVALHGQIDSLIRLRRKLAEPTRS